MIIEKITTYSDLLKMQPVWDEILQKSCDNLALLTFDVIKTEWQHLGWEFDTHRQMTPFILILKEDNEILSIASFVKEKRKLYGFPVVCIRPLCNIHADRVDIIIVKNSAKIVDAIINYLTAEESPWDVLMMKNVSSESDFMGQILSLRKTIKMGILPGYSSPFVKVNASWQKYFEGRSRNVRSKLKNKLNRLTRDKCQVSAREYRTSDELEFALGKAFQIDMKSWKAEEGTAISSTEKSRRYWHSLTQELSIKDRVRIWILWINNDPVAFEYHIVYCDKVYSLKWSYDKDYQRYSPGLLLKYASMKAFWDRNVTEVDLLGNSDSFKVQWTDMIRYHYNIYIFNKAFYSKFLHHFIFGLRKLLLHFGLLNSNKNPKMPDSLGLHISDKDSNSHASTTPSAK